MQVMTEAVFQKDLYLNIEASKQEPLCIATDRGNFVIMSEDEFNGLVATADISTNHAYKDELIKRRNAPDNEFIDESELSW